MDTLTGSNVASLIYEFAGTNNEMNKMYYGGVDVPPVVKYSDETPNKYNKDSLFALTFEEMKDTLPNFNGNFVAGDCLPKLKHDTTSTCAVKVIPDFFGDSDEPYEVMFLEDEHQTAVMPKVKTSLLNVAVSARNISVWGRSRTIRCRCSTCRETW